MRDQFAGDISDLLKFSLLRSLVGEDKKLGIGWYFVDEENQRTVGRHREFCAEQKWESLDSEVWEALRNLPERSVAALERLKFWPIGTKFHRIPIEPGPGRENWFDGMKSHLEGCSVVFLDPDNGLGKPGLLHASIEEVHSLQETIPAVVLIKFPGRTKHSQQIEEHHRSLLKNKNTKWVFTIRTCVSINCRTKTGKHQKIPRIRWFTVINPDQCITRRANSFVTKMKNLKDVKAEIVSMEGFGN